jgi:uncharacterized repeat protein (TIGR01451 family)
MEFNLRRFIFLITGLLLLSCNNDDDIDPLKTSDLSISIEAGSAIPAVGTRLVFILTATNNGPLDATEVVVKNKIPSGYSFESFDAAAGDYDSTAGIWTIGELKNQESTTLNIVVIVNPTGNYNSTASISGGQADLVKTNSNASIVFSPIILTEDMLFTYKISEGNDKFVTITGLSQLWQDLNAADKLKIVVPNKIQGHSVTQIGDKAFENQNETISITLPNSITKIGNRSFGGCSGLKNITIPEQVTFIGSYAFSNCTSLTNITIPNSVLSIGEGTFEYCSGLTDIIIPESVASIEDYLFAYCTNIKSVKLPANAERIGYRVFYDCSNLTNVNLPTTLKVIESSVFYGCTNLAQIIIPETVEEIRDYAFIGCEKVTNIRIPNNVKKIGIEVFNGCTDLTSFSIDTNPYFSVIDGVLYDKEAKTLRSCPMGKTGSFVIPNSVTEIGHSAFVYCKKLTSITIPNSVAVIKPNAFRFCSGLTSITIPKSVTSIGFYAFSDNLNLKTVTLNPIAPPSINTNLLPFANCENLTGQGAIKVPAENVGVYKSTLGWLTYKDIISAQ